MVEAEPQITDQGLNSDPGEPKISYIEEDGCINIELNNKLLRLLIDPNENEAATRLDNIENNKHVPGTTTRLYQCAFEIMQAFTTETNTPLLYLFATNSEKLSKWAQHPQRGMAIFNWEWISDDPSFFEASVAIYPDISVGINLLPDAA